MSNEAPPPYVYRCEDRSILLEPYKRHFLPLWKWTVPRWLPANQITLGSSACMWVVFGLSLRASAFSVGPLTLAFLALTQSFVAYDHLDGMQAKATGTSSALGEFLDHSLDVYHGAIFTISACALLGVVPPWLVLLGIWFGLVPFATTMVEEKERGVLMFGWFGAVEASLSFIGFYVSWLFPAARAWWVAPLVGGLPAYSLLFFAGGLGGLGTMIDSVRRMRRVPPALAAYFAASLVLLVALGRSAAPAGWLIVAMLLHGGDYVGRVIGSHLIGRPHAWPDFVAPLFALAALFGPAWIITALLAWLAVRTAWGIVHVVWPLRGGWRWQNPPAKPA